MLFVKPPPESFRDASLGDTYYLKAYNARTYAEYNYLGGGLAARVKLGHFNRVLRLCSRDFGTCDVLDFGCADGVFLPSLATYFPHATGVDVREDFVLTAQAMVRNLSLANCNVICNGEMTFGQLRKALGGRQYRLAFMLEVLEHVGSIDTMYEDKVALVGEVLNLLREDGRLVVSVPKMTGPAFLLQRFGLAVLRLRRERLTWGELFAAGLCGKTSGLEKRWCQDHLGFNQNKLEAALSREFTLSRERGTLFQAIYTVSK
jgi:2-polyprenyl-3-methyl-5-hydroxy-6-metoxy-1,4-benzoquinol methylase